MKWLFEWYRNYQLEKIRLKNEATNQPFKMMREVLDRFAVMQSEQTKVLQTWMDSFKVHDVPTTTRVSDDDEFTAEQNKEYERIVGGGTILTHDVKQSLQSALDSFGGAETLKDLFNHDGDM